MKSSVATLSMGPMLASTVTSTGGLVATNANSSGKKAEATPLKAQGKKARKTNAQSGTQKQPPRKTTMEKPSSLGMNIAGAIEETVAVVPAPTSTTPSLATLRAASAGASKVDVLKHPIKQQSFKIARDKERKEKLWKNLGEDRPVDAPVATSPEVGKSRNHRVFLAPARRTADMQHQRPSWGQSQMSSVDAASSSVAEQLHAEILEYAEYTRKTVRTMAVHIEEMISNVRSSVCSLWSKARVEPFGSYSTGIWLPSSDVDLVILGVVEIHNRMLTVKFLKQLAQALETQAWVESIHVLDSAKIPVLKLVTAESNVPIDITFESTATHSGLLARDLIKKYAKEMPELYPLAIVFKQLLRERDLNDAYTGGLSSYSIVLMIIHFQQLWRGGGYCFKAGAMFAAGRPLPRPADLVKQLGADTSAATKRGASSQPATKLNSPTKAIAPAKALTSSFAAIVSASKAVKRSPPEATPAKQPFSYAAVAAGIVKIPHAPTPPSSYAAAVSASKTQPAPRTTQVVRMPIVVKPHVTGAQAAEHPKDAVSVTSSLADTEDLSSCGDSPATSTADDTDEESHETSSTSSAQEHVSLGELTMNILEFFGITFDFRKNGISVRDGGYIYRLAEPTELGKKLPPIVIEDPIHPDRNVSASSFAFSKVVSVLEDSFYALKYFHPTRFTPTALSCLLSVSGHTLHTPKPVTRQTSRHTVTA